MSTYEEDTPNEPEYSVDDDYTKCPVCGRIGENYIDYYPVKGHPNIESKWLVCKCGHDIREIEE